MGYFSDRLANLLGVMRSGAQGAGVQQAKNNQYYPSPHGSAALYGTNTTTTTSTSLPPPGHLGGIGTFLGSNLINTGGFGSPIWSGTLVSMAFGGVEESAVEHDREWFAYDDDALLAKDTRALGKGLLKKENFYGWGGELLYFQLDRPQWHNRHT